MVRRVARAAAAHGQAFVRAARHRRALRCEPAHDLASLAASDGRERWRAVGDDPQFTIELPAGGCTPGWYRFALHADAQVGRLTAPSLYIDDGSGFSQERCAPLQWDAADRLLHGIIHVTVSLVRLRLDPSSEPCEFEIGRPTLSRLGRLQAAERLVMSLDDTERDGRLRDCLDSDPGVLDAQLAALAVQAGLRQAQRAAADVLRYADWLARFDTPGPAVTDAADIGTPAQPLISLLVPVFNTDPRWLQRCIDSVTAQSYPHWELCLADDASTRPGIGALLRAAQEADPRVRVTFRERNGHISAASNTALAMATGDYVALLDHDDELHPHALHHIARTVCADPAVGLLYSDEDKIDAGSLRFDPYFKPDWNPDLLLAHNFISHLGVYRTALVRELGGFREGYEGSQDHDLALRCSERLRPQQIAHIPHVLYHWRAIAGSTALAAEQKDYAADASLRAIDDHLRRQGSTAQVSRCPTSHQYRVRHRVPTPAPLVSLIVPTRDQPTLLAQCIDGLLHRTAYPNLEILVVDNQSTEPATLDYLARLECDPRARVLRHDAPFNYPAINNRAVAQARGSLIGLINNDIEVIDPGWLDEMVSHACREDIGAVGAKLFYPDGRIQHAGVILGVHGVAAHPYSRKPGDHPGDCNRARLIQNLSAVTAACLLVRASLYAEVGGLDERLAVAFNDVDFCLRLRERGYRNLWTPYARLIHHESVSRGAEDTAEKKARFADEVGIMRRRWGELLDADPAYNPNLTRTGEPFALNFDR